jgi:hypothetical protein
MEKENILGLYNLILMNYTYKNKTNKKLLNIKFFILK